MLLSTALAIGGVAIAGSALWIGAREAKEKREEAASAVRMHDFDDDDFREVIQEEVEDAAQQEDDVEITLEESDKRTPVRSIIIRDQNGEEKYRFDSRGRNGLLLPRRNSPEIEYMGVVAEGLLVSRDDCPSKIRHAVDDIVGTFVSRSIEDNNEDAGLISDSMKHDWMVNLFPETDDDLSFHGVWIVVSVYMCMEIRDGMKLAVPSKTLINDNPDPVIAEAEEAPAEAE